MSRWGLGGLLKSEVNIPSCLAKPQSDIVLCQRNYHMFFFFNSQIKCECGADLNEM